ncbi:hypothetical protein RHSIM_Rhsim03G0176200 [Rhododendron simsii]|uniref:ABC transporter B family member 28 n=1 Tax=Rhododendron simsii TaxID=118357 RepID=A0A834H7S5_RHOSS|nr:hypothetical protein RHSIM_Rhsim03G0176200 [Rhododendron simsii]
MASPTHSVALSLLPPRYTLPKPHTHHLLPLSSSTRSSLLPPRRRSSALSLPYGPPRRRSSNSTCLAYVTGPPSDPIVADNGPTLNISSSDTESTQSPPSVISWGLLSSLLLQHKLRLAVSVVTLVGCTACTLSMPLYSGKFFEVLIGKTPKPLWDVLGRIAVLYALEPIFTILFVVNLTLVWEKVMSHLRAQIFQRVLIQKVEFFDRYKVGELTALLTSDLGSLKDIVSENISRDRGFRALSEASYSTLNEIYVSSVIWSLLFLISAENDKGHWNNMYLIHSIPPACTTAWATYAYGVCFSCAIEITTHKRVRPSCGKRVADVEIYKIANSAIHFEVMWHSGTGPQMRRCFGDCKLAEIDRVSGGWGQARNARCLQKVKKKQRRQLQNALLDWFVTAVVGSCFSYFDCGSCLLSAAEFPEFSAVYKRSTVPVFKAHGMAQASIADCVNETLSAIRTVRSFGGEKRQMSMFSSQVIAYQTSGIKLGVFKSINESLTRIAVYISLLALYCLGGSKVKAGELSAGTVVSFIGYTFTLTFAVQGLVNTFGDLRGAFAATERINSVLYEAEIDEALAYGLERDIKLQGSHDKNFELFFVNGSNTNNQSLNMHYMSALKSTSSLGSLAWSGDICLEDVHFSYPLRPDVEILNGLNLTLKCGSVTALVGSSGAGKSTIVQLLARFYEPTRGRITVGGEDVRTFDKSEWARVVSIVNQEPVLFSLSVGENIAYGLPDDLVSKDNVIKAAKAANAHDFIISLPQGYDTLVGERGGLLSGGQRQRIAIARALLKDAPILILDEVLLCLASREMICYILLWLHNLWLQLTVFWLA